ncbi:MAG: hypothetical protein MJE66_16405 [Proteobacteria bacterium]|nr:hypothetical protein [Pseudomonadota bacterium]
MLSKFDDYAIHPTPEPIAHAASSDRNVYDRYWFNGYASDGEFYFGIALGRYPNRGIMDCGFSVVADGEQHSFHASRRAPDEPTETQVGPFRIEILEPMMSLRVVLEPNETGIECDLVFVPRTASVEEGRQTLRNGRHVMMDSTRFAQYGHWRGRVRYGGRELAIDPERVYATKDRSWGIRPVGEPEAGGAPLGTAPQFFFLWAPLQWEDHCTHFGVFEDENGHKWHEDAQIVPAYASPDAIPGVVDPDTQKWARAEHRVVYEPGTRRAESAEIALVSKTGERREISLEPLLRFQMKGIGYTHPEWGHGRWKGELAIGGESWKTAELDPLAVENLHTQQVVKARSEGREGVGVLEQICIGRHAPSGFEGVIDGAK